MSDLKAAVTPMDMIGWSCCIIIPSIIYFILQDSNLSWAGSNFIVIFSAALMMWIFRLVPEYVPAVFVILSTVWLGIAPQMVLLSGFASESFFLAMSVFGLGTVIVHSRIFYRLSLFILIQLPKKVPLLQGFIFFLGALITPVMTAQSSRVALIAPLLEDIGRNAKLLPKGALANSLACCAFHGVIILSAVFLTGKSSNFVLFGMLSKQIQWQFGWLNWLKAAAFPGLLMIVAFFCILKMQFRTPNQLDLNLTQLSKEYSSLGKFSIDEWAAIFGIFILIVGLMTSSIHQISAPWLCFAIFFILMATGILNKQRFKLGINWPFLFYLGAIIGIMRCVQVTGVDEWLVTYMSWLEAVADNSSILFLMLIYIIGWLGSFLFGTAAAPALLFTLLLPMAEHAAINTWLIAFVLLMATESWLFPYQSSYYLCFEELLEKNQKYQLSKTLKVNAYFCLVRFLIIIASIPVWKMMEIL